MAARFQAGDSLRRAGRTASRACFATLSVILQQRPHRSNAPSTMVSASTSARSCILRAILLGVGSRRDPVAQATPRSSLHGFAALNSDAMCCWRPVCEVPARKQAEQA